MMMIAVALSVEELGRAMGTLRDFVAGEEFVDEDRYGTLHVECCEL